MTVAEMPAHEAAASPITDLPMDVPAEVVAAARNAYPKHRRRRQCSMQDFESGYIAYWREHIGGSGER